jgi:hypothetical protein
LDTHYARKLPVWSGYAIRIDESSFGPNEKNDVISVTSVVEDSADARFLARSFRL